MFRFVACSVCHPFGNQASAGISPSALGFAPRPFNRFAFIEDEEATGLRDARAPPVGQAHPKTRLKRLLRQGCISAAPLRLTLSRPTSTVNLGQYFHLSNRGIWVFRKIYVV
jgi:hypothetical protein